MWTLQLSNALQPLKVAFFHQDAYCTHLISSPFLQDTFPVFSLLCRKTYDNPFAMATQPHSLNIHLRRHQLFVIVILTLCARFYLEW